MKQIIKCAFSSTRDLLDKSRMDIDIGGDFEKEVCHVGRGRTSVDILFEFVDLLVLVFELEVELFDAVLELLVVNFELKPRDLGNVDESFVHAIKLTI